MEIRNSVNYANTCGSEYKTHQLQGDESRQLVNKFTNLQYQRKLQKKREEQELKERRERKERVEEALEAYAKYRRELRHYYNELGYQKKLAASSGDASYLVNVKRPPVVSAAYELIMMLGM